MSQKGASNKESNDIKKNSKKLINSVSISVFINSFFIEFFKLFFIIVLLHYFVQTGIKSDMLFFGGVLAILVLLHGVFLIFYIYQLRSLYAKLKDEYTMQIIEEILFPKTDHKKEENVE